VLPDDPVVHACVLTYISDLGWAFGAIEHDGERVGGPSLDHAVWFQRPVDPAGWMFLELRPVTLAGVRPAGVYRQVKNPYVDRYLRSQRETLYPGGLFGRGRAAGQDETQKTARLIMDYVRQGGRLGFISDLWDANGIAVPFFGYPAKSMPIAAMIARRVGARIWIGRCMRIGNRACFDVNVNELRIPRTSNQAEDIRNITAAIQRHFETWIRETPEQFMWSNRRWS